MRCDMSGAILRLFPMVGNANKTPDMDKEPEIELEIAESKQETLKKALVRTHRKDTAFTVCYRGCGDRVSYRLQANEATGLCTSYVVEATGPRPVKLAYNVMVKKGEFPKTAVVTLAPGKTHRLEAPLRAPVKDSMLGEDALQIVGLTVLGEHRLWLLGAAEGAIEHLMFDWDDFHGCPRERILETGLPAHGAADRLTLDEGGVTSYEPTLSRPFYKTGLPELSQLVQHEKGHTRGLDEDVVEQARKSFVETAGAHGEAVRAEISRRNDVIFNNVDTSSCKVYDTREGERWVFFSHNAAASISPIVPVDNLPNTFSTSFSKFNEGTDVPYVLVDGKLPWAVRGEHSAIMLDGPVIDQSKLFQVYPSRVDGDYDSWTMTYSKPEHYNLLVVPMDGGTVIGRINGENPLPRGNGLTAALGGIALSDPVVFSGDCGTIDVVSGSCMVFALHESLSQRFLLPDHRFDAEVDPDGKRLWLPMGHPSMFQWNRETRDASFVHHLCIGIPADVAPDETAVALYHLDKGRGIIRAVGGDVYYSLETYKDAYNVRHSDGRIAAGSAVVVDTGEFTGIALYGPHDIRPLEEGQSPNGDGVRAALKPRLEMHYGGETVSVTVLNGEVELPKGFRRTREHSIRYLAGELAYKELYKAASEASQERAAGKPGEKEPPCPEVEPHDGLCGYIKVLFRGCRWETDTGKPLPEHYGPNCYVLVPENRMDEIGSFKFMEDIVRIVNDWAAPYALQSYKDSGVTGICATDRMGRERVMPCDEDGNALFYTVQFKGVQWMRDGNVLGGQDTLEVRVPKTGPSLEIDGRAAGSVIGEAVLKAEKGQDATMYYRNVYFVC